jgi:hypothetical protein
VLLCRYAATQASRRAPCSGPSGVPLPIAAGIRHQVALLRALERTAEMAILVSKLPAVQIDNHLAPRSPDACIETDEGDENPAQLLLPRHSQCKK